MRAGAPVRQKPLSRETAPLHRDHRGSIEYSPPRKRPSTERVAARVQDGAQKDLKPRSRDPTPLRRDSRPSSGDKTPTAERRSAERVAARVRDGELRDQRPRSRDPTPLRRDSRPSSGEKTPTAERRSAERGAARVRDGELRDQRPRSRDPTPLRRDARPGSRDRTPAAERRSLERVPARLKTDGRRTQDTRSRDPTPPSRGRRSDSKELAPIAERRSTERVAVEVHGNAHKCGSQTLMPERRSSQKDTDGAQDDTLIITFDTPEHEQPGDAKAAAPAAPRPLSSDKEAPPADRRSSENAGKDRKSQQLSREERLHQLHEARRAGRMPAELSSKRSRSRSQSRRETPPKRACVGSGLRKASGPQDSSQGQRRSDQQASRSRPNTASGESMIARVTAETTSKVAVNVLFALAQEA